MRGDAAERGTSDAPATRDTAGPVVDALSELLGGESPRSRRFLGGLVAGALVGAAIAGSTIWRRIAKHRH